MKTMEIFSENYCRFCLQQPFKLHKINKTDEDSFYDLTQLRLSKALAFSGLSTSVCGDCREELTKCSAAKRKFTENQEKLEKDVTKWQPVVKLEYLKDSLPMFNEAVIKKEEPSFMDESNDNFEFFDAFADTLESDDSSSNYDIQVPEPIEEVPVKRDRRKTCNICGSSVLNLKEHMKYTHRKAEKVYFCDYCDFSCFFKNKIQIHVQSHIPKEFRNTVKCPQCDFRCVRKDTLNQHIKNLHSKTERPRKFKCEECDKAYFTQTNLKEHVKAVHRNQRDASCPHCDKKFFTLKDLKLHVPRHFEKQEKCPQCDGLFFTQAEVRGHIKRVHLPPTVKCPYEGCDRMFYNNDKLKMHIIVRHEKVKNYVCVECGAAFAQPNTLKRHTETRHMTLRVACPVENCGFSMKRKEKFIRHINKYHGEFSSEEKEKLLKSLKYETAEQKQHVKEFICPDCGKIFTKYHNLKNHIQKGHEKKIQPTRHVYCTVDGCSYKTTRKYRLRKHLLKSHQYMNEEAIELILSNPKYESSL